MPVVPARMDATKAGSMTDRIDPAQHERGMMRERRNEIDKHGRWDTRPTMVKINTVKMPWTNAIGPPFGYRDKQGDRHVLVVGDDGNVYHDVDWTTAVVKNDVVTWDGTYKACFAAWGDDCFIAIGSEDGAQVNLRYDGLLGQLFGVSIDAPVVTAMTATEGIAGAIDAATYAYKVSYYHTPAVGTVVEGALSAATTIVLANDDKKIDLAGIPVMADAAGRTIHRRIYRSDGGEAYALVHTLEDNTTAAWSDNTATATGIAPPAESSFPLPVCRYVAATPDGIVIWFNDVESDQPATYYISLDHSHPELYGEFDYAGTHDDPITAPYQVRDGIFVGKRRSIQWLNKQCKTCEGVIRGVGVVAWATVQNNGAEVAWLSQRGPCSTNENLRTDYAFCGPSLGRYALSETWEGVTKKRLPFAGSFHAPELSLMGWWVQMRDQVTGRPDFNDTILWWDYGSRNQYNPNGRVGIWDMLGSYAALIPGEGTEADEVWCAMPYGFIAKMLVETTTSLVPGDGTTEAIYGALITDQTGTTVTINDAAWSPIDEAWTGSVLYIYGGTGSRSCRSTLPNDRPDALITSHYGGTLELASEVSLDATSKVWIGGFKWVADVDGMGHEIPAAMKNLTDLDVQLKGTA